MFANNEPPLVYTSITLRTPPMIMSPEKMVPLVPSENVSVSMPQSSTSSGLLLIYTWSCGGRLRPDGIHDHRCMQCRRRADIDDIDFAIVDQIAEIAISLSNFVLLGKIKDVIAACGNRNHLRINSVDALVSVHMQFGDEATSDKTDHHF